MSPALLGQTVLQNLHFLPDKLIAKKEQGFLQKTISVDGQVIMTRWFRFKFSVKRRSRYLQKIEQN